MATNAGIHTKYRVFREPNVETDEGHPVSVNASYLSGTEFGPDGVGEVWESLEEITDGMFFLLRPATDHHARVALAAYAASVGATDIQLAEDIWDMLGDASTDQRSG